MKIIIDSIGNGPINDALLRGAHDSRRRARALIKVHGGGVSLNESILKWFAWLEREEPAEVVLGGMV